MSRDSLKIFHLCFSTMNYITNIFLLVGWLFIYLFLLIQQINPYPMADTVLGPIAAEFVRTDKTPVSKFKFLMVRDRQ